MANPQWKPEIVEEKPEQSSETNFAELLLDRLLNLKVLSQKAVVAISDLFSLITAGTVFWLALAIIPFQPSAYQLSGLAGYALFIIALNVIVRGKR